MITKKFNILALILIACVGIVAATVNANRSVTAKAAVDQTMLLMGKTATIDIEFAGVIPEGFRLVDSALVNVVDSFPDVEVTPNGDFELSDLGNGRSQIHRSYTVQAFDSGLFVLPSVMLIADDDTVLTNPLALKVTPVELDTALIVYNDAGEAVDLTIHPMTDVASVEKKAIDYVPDWIISWGWWVLLAILVIAAVVFVYMKWLRYGKIPLMPAKKPVPPYDLAMAELSKLREDKLWQKGSEKEYYTRLTDILRKYMQGRFGINAMEMTSSQILDALSKCEEATPGISLMTEVLRQADFVKFAKARPMADDNERSFANSLNFVETTRPLPDPAEENADSSSDDAAAAKSAESKKSDNGSNVTQSVNKGN